MTFGEVDEDEMTSSWEMADGNKTTSINYFIVFSIIIHIGLFSLASLYRPIMKPPIKEEVIFVTSVAEPKPAPKVIPLPAPAMPALGSPDKPADVKTTSVPDEPKKIPAPPEKSVAKTTIPLPRSQPRHRTNILDRQKRRSVPKAAKPDDTPVVAPAPVVPSPTSAPAAKENQENPSQTAGPAGSTGTASSSGSSQTSNARAGTGHGGRGGPAGTGSVGRGLPNGIVGGTQDLLKGYAAGIHSLLERHKHYPPLARRRNHQGKVMIKFTITDDGHLFGQPTVEHSSGYETLDEAALKCVHAAAPFPALPREIEVRPVTFKMTLAFVLE
ncbi:MAG: energy transducer TonB [Deltaproteobacteria bacterium]|nr:energy transducer TonB [Deltaproteobacteria bacterium]